MLRPIASLIVIVGLVAGCGGAPASSQPTPTAAATAVRSAAPASIPGPTASPTVPSPSPTPTPTLEPIRGWPVVERDGVSLRGRRLDTVRYGRLRFSVVVEGLDPGATVTVRARGDYEVRWACGVEPEPCGDVGCGPTDWTSTSGTATTTARATAGPDGTATIRIRLAAPPPPDTCHGDGAPWGGWEHTWTRIRITDREHGLMLTPGRVYEGDTI